MLKMQQGLNIHEDIYTKANGEYTAPWIIKAWGWLRNIHSKFPNDILQLDIARFPLLFDEKQKIIKDLKSPDNPFWNIDNPYPINSVTNDNSILEFIDSQKLTRTHIMIQTREEIVELIRLKNKDPVFTVLVTTQYITSRNPEKALTGEAKQFAVAIVLIIRIKKDEIFISLS